MDADATEDPLLPGYSVPIRAPLTIDSDSEFCLSVKDRVYSRTSSFNSSSSSIDISSYGVEHTSVLEEESDDLVAYPDENIVIQRSHVEESCFIRPFVRYPDDNFVKELKDSCGFSDSTVFRPFVKVPYEESSSLDVGGKPSVPIAPLTGDSDSDSDGDSVGGGCWDDAGWIPGDGIVQKVTMAPKVRSFNGDEGDDEVDDAVQVEGVFSGDDMIGSENLSFVATELVENERYEVEYLNEVVKLCGSGASSVDLERIDVVTVSSSNNEIEIERNFSEADELSLDSESISVRIVSKSDSDSIGGSRWDDGGWISADAIVQKVTMAPKVRSFIGDKGDDELQVEGVFSGDDITEIENMNFVSTESVETEGCKVECLNEVVKLYGSAASSFDLDKIDALTVLSSNNEIEIETKLSDKLSFDSGRIDAPIVSNADSEIEDLNYVSNESFKYEGCKVECLHEVKLSEADALSFLERIDKQIETIREKLSELDEPSFASERIDSQVASNSDSGIKNSSSVSTESMAKEGCKVEPLTEVAKLSDLDALSLDLERIEAQTASSSNNDIEIETIDVRHSEPDKRIDTQNVSNSDSEIEIKTMNGVQEAVIQKEEEPLKKMQRIRAKFLRLALNEQLTTKVNGEGGNYNFDFSLTILAIGKTGVGKSATINSIFGENKAATNAFDLGTTTIQEITGNVDGIQLRVIDTPGLKCSYLDRSYNLRVLNSIKRFTRKHTPNVVLYVDRLDTLDVNDSQLLKLIMSSLGSSVWQNCIIALTHAGCDPSDEPSKRLTVRRCRFLQEQVVSFGGNDRRVANPVWLVDNNPSCIHDVVDLCCDLQGLACLDQADEDD